MGDLLVAQAAALMNVPMAKKDAALLQDTRPAATMILILAMNGEL